MICKVCAESTERYIKCVCSTVVCIDCICINPNILPECPNKDCRRPLSVFEFLDVLRYDHIRFNPYQKKRSERFIEEDVSKQSEAMTAIQIHKLINGAKYGEGDALMDQFFLTVLGALPLKDLEHILSPLTAMYFIDTHQFKDKFELLQYIPVNVFLQEYDSSINLKYIEVHSPYNIYAAHVLLNILPKKVLENILNACMNRVVGLLKDNEELAETKISEYLGEDIEKIFLYENCLYETLLVNRERIYPIMIQKISPTELVKRYIAKIEILSKLKEIHSNEAKNIIVQVAKKFFNITEPRMIFKIFPDSVYLEMKNNKKFTPLELSNFFLDSYLSYQRNKLPPNEVISKCTSCSGLIIKIDESFICNMCAKMYCNKCLMVAADNHICDQANVKSAEEILMNSKPCPKCGVRIQKSKGCDLMFCVKCKAGFCYNTGVIIDGEFHNPHRTEWLSTSVSEYDLAEVPRHFTNTKLQFYVDARYKILEMIANYGTNDHRIENDLFKNRYHYLKREYDSKTYYEHIQKTCLYDLYTRAVGDILKKAESKIKKELIKAKQKELLEKNGAKFNLELFEMYYAVTQAGDRLVYLEKFLHYNKVEQIFRNSILKNIVL
jgi:regulator of RNase E activity RraB